MLWNIFQQWDPLWRLVFMELSDCVTITHFHNLLKALSRGDSRVLALTILEWSCSGTLNTFSVYVRWPENCPASLDRWGSKIFLSNVKFENIDVGKAVLKAVKPMGEFIRHIWRCRREHADKPCCNANTKNAYGNWSILWEHMSLHRNTSVTNSASPGNEQRNA